MNKNKSKYLISSIIFLVIVFLSIGFSAFQTTLFVDDFSAIVRLNENIRVTGISSSSSTGEAISNYEDYNIASLYLGAYLPNADSIITYQVEVTNFGNVENGIFDVYGLPENLTYELEDYQLKQKICDSSNKCTLGAKKVFYITIKYKDNGFDNSNLTYNLTLDVDFRKFYTITYNNINHAENYPKEIMSGDNLIVQFKDDLPIVIKVEYGATILPKTDFTYQNYVFKLSSVTKNIVISRLKALYEQISDDNKTILNKDCPETIGPNGKYVFLTQDSAGGNLCTAPDDLGTSYYYRGLSNNYVKFAGYNWRIIRINGDNTVRMLYSGEGNDWNGNIGSAAFFDDSSVSYSERRENPAYLGYKIGNPNANSYESTHTNNNGNSTLKSLIDNWYLRSNLPSNASYLADGIFCNDRQTYDMSDIDSVLGIKKRDGDYGTGFGGNTDVLGFEPRRITYWASMYRLIDSELNNETKAYPTLICAQKNDRYTKDNEIGNKELDYPIAVLSADELYLGGASYAFPLEYTTLSGIYTITMTPSAALPGQHTSDSVGYYGIFHEFEGTLVLGAGAVESERKVSPVININAETYVKNGKGTLEDPYIFD